MTQAMKVYQIAEQLGMDHEIVVAKIRAFGIPVNNKMSKIDGDVAEQIKSSLLKDKQQDWVEIDMGNGVRKRVRKTPVAAPPAPEPARAREVREEEAPAPVQTPVPPAPVESHASAPEPVEQPVERKPVAATAQTAPAPSAPVQPPASPAAHREPEVAEPARETRQPATSTARVETAAATTAPVTPVTAPAAARESAPTPAPESSQPAATISAEPLSAPSRTQESAPTPRQEAPAAAAFVPSNAPVQARETTGSAPPPSVEPPAGPAVRPVPSVPPPRTGTVVYDPVSKTVTHVQSNTPLRTRSVQVDPNRLKQTDTRGSTGPRGLSGPGRPGGPAGRAGPGARRPGFRGPAMAKGPAPIPTIMGAHKRVVKIEGQIALQELARRMSIKASDVLFKLIGMGMTGVNINSTLDADTAKIVAQEFQYEVSDVAVADDAGLKAIVPEFADNPADYIPRPPVVTVMGHVDHGKTTLLDAILGMRVAEGEAGGITQKVSAYRVETPKGPVVFFDTPGHEAFTKLRARGAETTDVAVLVVAADDGVMPTTIEAINHAKAAQVPIVVALNKMDKPDAKPDRVLQQLMEHDIVAEQFGGEVLVVQVSAKMRTGVTELLESLALQTEILDLRANPKRPAVGTVFDATLDKGRGVVARILVQDGTLRSGDVVLAGLAYGKVRAMFDDRGKAIAKAGPSTPVEILGLNELPNAGDGIYVVQDLKKAQAFADERRLKAGPVMRPMGGFGTPGFPDINALLAAGETINLGIIIKADAQASVEALSKALTELSTDKVKIQMVHTGIGAITESDVNLAIASKGKAVIIGFNVRPQGKTSALAETEGVQIRLYTIIYEAVDDIKLLMIGQLKPTFIEKPLGRAEVRQVFNITKVGQIAGCYVTEGQFKRTARARLMRDSAQIWEGKLSSLKRFKDDVKEVGTGYECGIGLENYNDVKPGDFIDAFELEEVAAKL